MKNTDKVKIIYVDVDETICKTPESRRYEDATPISDNIKKINQLYDEGNTIVYWTSRGSRKQIDWTELTTKQLAEWGCRYNELRLDKPYYDLFIDDKTLRIEEI